MSNNRQADLIVRHIDWLITVDPGRRILRDAAIAVNPPVDLGACSDQIHSGLSRLYELRFIRRCRAAIQERVEDGLIAECAARMDDEVKRLEALPPRAPSTMFDHLYAKFPAAYRAQRAELEQSGPSHG